MRTISHTQNFLLISIIPRNLSDEEAIQNLQELASLVDSFGGNVVDILLQNREVHDKGLYIGRGKINEASKIIAQKKIDLVVLNAIIPPGQLYDFKTIFYHSNPKIEVWDKIDLILHIFSKHAQTAEAQLQIEIAAMRHMGPRIYGMGLELSRQGGGIGTRGIGETNTELMKRHWQNQMKKAYEKLDKLTNAREQQLKRRKNVGLKTVSIVGYTNAGKTALFNRLTRKKKLVKNALFATLDSTVGKIYLPTLKQEILISDTIGFIRDLSPQLIDAFKSTLMETLHADLLLHVIDISDPDMDRKIQTVEEILKSLRIDQKNRIYVFNKIDVGGQNISKISDFYNNHKCFFVSANTSEGIEDLIQAIGEILKDKASQAKQAISTHTLLDKKPYSHVSTIK